MAEDPTEIARTLTARILAKDVAGVDALYHDEAIVWRNLDGRDLSKRQLLKVVTFLTTRVADLRYDDVRVQGTATGFVQQHTLRGVAPNGEQVVAHACLVATVEDGRIRRLDEYLDSAALASLMG